MDSRREKRSPNKFPVRLSNGTKPVIAECVLTEDVSVKGARVRTVRPWKPDSRLLLKSSWLSEVPGQARVVYCESLPDTTFAVGLEFLVLEDAWDLE